MISKNLFDKVIFYGKRYIDEILTVKWDLNEILNNWWSETCFFLSFTFYQARRDKLSGRVEQTALKELKKYFTGKKNELKELIMQDLKPLRLSLAQVIGRGKIGKGRDIEMILSALNYIYKIPENKIVSYSIEKVKKKYTSNLFKELKENIHQVGNKVSSFYLRDLITIFSLDKYLLKDDYVFLMPIDTQVKKFALKTRIITNEKEKDANIRQKIVDYCIKFKVNPLRFNQGAWFLGAHCFDILLENLEKF